MTEDTSFPETICGRAEQGVGDACTVKANRIGSTRSRVIRALLLAWLAGDIEPNFEIGPEVIPEDLLSK
jgi:hypothetical protein